MARIARTEPLLPGHDGTRVGRYRPWETDADRPRRGLSGPSYLPALVGIDDSARQRDEPPAARRFTRPYIGYHEARARRSGAAGRGGRNGMPAVSAEWRHPRAAGMWSIRFAARVEAMQDLGARPRTERVGHLVPDCRETVGLQQLAPAAPCSPRRCMRRYSLPAFASAYRMRPWLGSVGALRLLAMARGGLWQWTTYAPGSSAD